MGDTDYDALAEEAGDEALDWLHDRMPPLTVEKMKEIRGRLPTEEDRAAWDLAMAEVNETTAKNIRNQALVKFAAAGTAGAVKLMKEALKAAA